MTTRFEQAQIPVQNEPVFHQLRSVLEQALAPGEGDRFLARLHAKKLGATRFEKILAAGVLEGVNAPELYGQLPPSDQGLLREWYLTRIDGVPLELRRKYHKVYQYY